MIVFRKKKVLMALFFAFAIVVGSFGNPPATYANPRNDRSAPTAPSNLKADVIEETSVFMTWNPSKDNVGVIGYDIYRDNGYIGSTITTAFRATGLNKGTTYRFHVVAKDAAGNVSKTSNTLIVTTVNPIPEPAPEPEPTPEPIPEPEPTLPPAPPEEAAKNRVVGYYASWSAYSGFTPDKIDGDKITHINYAFANIGSDLKIALGDSYIDPINFGKLSTLKQNYPHLKTLISVGGWTWSGRFSDVALTDASRAAFADSAVAFIVRYGFDGIDLDWEYPVSGGLASNVKRPEDKQNFTLLMKKLREKLDAQSALDGKEYLLTFAGGAGAHYVANVQLDLLHQYVDFGNIMTYDIHGTWDSFTDFVAPLYNNADVSPQYKWSVDAGVKAWLKAGFPAEKLVVGVPFYGYRYNGVTNANNGLYQRFTSGSSISYANVAANFLHAAGYKRYYHPESMVPWLFNGSTFISYEDEQSMGLKAQYIQNNGLGGAMIWELSHDPDKILLDALYNGLQK